jgi:hypothetical protein
MTNSLFPRQFRLFGSGSLATFHNGKSAPFSVLHYCKDTEHNNDAICCAAPKTRTGTRSEMFGTGELPLFGVRYWSPWGFQSAAANDQQHKPSLSDPVTSGKKIADRRNAGGSPCHHFSSHNGCRWVRKSRNSGSSNRLRRVSLGLIGRTAHRVHTHMTCYWGRGLDLINCISTPSNIWT